MTRIVCFAAAAYLLVPIAIASRSPAAPCFKLLGVAVLVAVAFILVYGGQKDHERHRFCS